MILFKTSESFTNYLSNQKNKNVSIGFVPTMGALHNGHITLVKASLNQGLCTVCSIFVNPTQFNNPDDFQKYPSTIESDILLLENAGCHVLFFPSVDEIYPTDFVKKVYELGEIENIVEGFYRPNHYQGVCQVVDRLLQIVQPNYLFLGEKDYQQCIIISKLITLENYSISVEIVPTLREESGLAMSSRNLRLSSKELQQASAIYQGLQYAKENIHQLPIITLQKKMKNLLLDNGFTSVDYISFCNTKTLQDVGEEKLRLPIVVLIAAYLNDVRLIDNITIN